MKVLFGHIYLIIVTSGDTWIEALAMWNQKEEDIVIQTHTDWMIENKDRVLRTEEILVYDRPHSRNWDI